MARVGKDVSVQWHKGGRRVPPRTPGADKVRVESRKYYAFWTEGGKTRKMPLCEGKSAALRMLTQLQQEGRLSEEGGTRKAGGLGKPIGPGDVPAARAVEDFVSNGRARKLNERTVRGREYLLTALVRWMQEDELGGAEPLLKDVTPGRCFRYMTEVRDWSAHSRCHFRTVLRQFFREAYAGIKAGSPMAELRPGGGVRQRKPRRALTPDEVKRLLTACLQRGEEAARACSASFTLRPLAVIARERHLVYRTALYTGLRGAEIRRLRVCDLKPEGEPYPWLELPAPDTKNREKDARLFLVPTFARDLLRWIEERGKKDGDKVFDVREQVVKDMKLDLEHAGIPFKDARGRQADFHSLRMCANTILARAGVPLHVRKLFMRHSDVRLTDKTYSDIPHEDLALCVEALEKLKLEGDEK